MQPSTLPIDFSFRLTLASAPFQPLLPRVSRLRDKSSILISLRTLILSCRSFCNSRPFFSIACGLFVQNAGGWGVPLRHLRVLRACPFFRRASALPFAFFVAPLFSSTYKSLLVAHRFATSLFSFIYKSLFPQPLCIHIYTKPRGVASKLWLTTDSVTPAQVAAASSEESKNSIVTNETLE